MLAPGIAGKSILPLYKVGGKAERADRTLIAFMVG
jgi:hypothetical protein